MFCFALPKVIDSLDLTNYKWQQSDLHLSQNHRMTEWLQLEVASGDHLIQCPSKAGTPRADCMESHPGLYWISPEKKTPQPLWVACSTALLPSIWRHFSSYSYGTSCVFCLSCHWAGVPWKESGPTWHLSLRYFWVFIIFTLHCLFFRLNKPNSLSLFFQREMLQSH